MIMIGKCYLMIKVLKFVGYTVFPASHIRDHLAY